MSEYQHKERDAYLRNLSKDFPGAWKSVQRTVERGSGPAYDEACRALAERAGQRGLQP